MTISCSASGKYLIKICKFAFNGDFEKLLVRLLSGDLKDCFKGDFVGDCGQKLITNKYLNMN